ncbi:MAG TPA: hypothetical protein VGP97_14350 [Burkholderiales bacterium]|jgi:hypothetical protein|nr:hypothetical protein [Burkholderiales bacterium]
MARIPRHQGRADPKIMGSGTSDTISDPPGEPMSKLPWVYVRDPDPNLVEISELA